MNTQSQRTQTQGGSRVRSSAPRAVPAVTGLTADHYTASSVFDLEQQYIAANCWVALCREDEVAGPGAYLATQLGDEPVVVVRDSRGRVRVLSNVCRHRGMVLVEGCGQASRLRCPYHAWTYGLNGQLHGAPLMRDQVAAHDCNLPTFSAWCWGGFVFANRNAGARPPRLAALKKHIANFCMDGFHNFHVSEEEWPCNWKCLIENFMDAYHLSVVHPETLRPLTPTHLSRKSVSGKAFTSYIAHYTNTAPPRQCHAPELTDAQRHQSHLFCVYPYLIASVSADTLAYLMLQPMGTERVKVRFGLSSFEADLSAAAKRERVTKWHAINAEDHAVLERLQRGLRSKVFKPGPLAPPDLEGSVADFHAWYRRNLAAATSGRAIGEPA